ncbi:CRISPR-associated endonuclease Cas2 [Hydrogenispora ethanolica]|uniref:CRISPR-associated endonuclease Cas2 n=1 Tax=Hydrogenispora ethanolica TaxID=1082276 RepID=UPI00104B489A|nr:CRISPR-associated endonuclease Cas2 [Hydrogenispora ethanolica]
MFVIVVYDIAEKRVAKVLKKSRQYLYWVQNSVFEGEISEAKYKKYVTELKKIINLEEDSVIIYNLRTSKYSSREVIGLEKGGQSNIL